MHKIKTRAKAKKTILERVGRPSAAPPSLLLFFWLWPWIFIFCIGLRFDIWHWPHIIPAQGPGVGAESANAGGRGGQSPPTSTLGALGPNMALYGQKSRTC